MLNGQTSNWNEVLAGVPQGSILGPLSSVIFINDIPEGIQSNIKIFADVTSMFSAMNDNDRYSAILSEDLNLISNWAFRWKMPLNPDPSKQAKGIVSSKKTLRYSASVRMFNNNVISSTDSHKYLGIILDRKLNFINHLKEKISIESNGIGIIRRLYNFLPKFTLINIYKAHVRPHLDYGDVTYDNSSNASLSQMIESVQYIACISHYRCYSRFFS